MPIQFANTELLLPDVDGELRSFLTRYLDERGANFFFPSVYDDDVRILSPVDGDADAIVLPLARPNWPEPPKAKVNTLYWPSGASRWGHMLLLVNGDGKDAIATACHGVSDAARPETLNIFADGFDGTLPTGDEDDWYAMDASNRLALGVKMYALKPHPVSLPTGITSDEELWIYPLVDIRYLWQWKLIESLNSDTYYQLILDIATEIDTVDLLGDLTIPNADYAGTPDVSGKQFNRINAAVLMDAACMTVGQRACLRFDSKLTAFNATDAETEWDESISAVRAPAFSEWAKAAGDEFEAEKGGVGVPESVVVLFHRDHTTEEITVSDLSSFLPFTEHVANTQKLIRIPYIDASLSANERYDFARRVALDFYLWQAKHADITFAGLKLFNPNGFVDYIEIEAGSFGRCEDLYHGQTRVVTFPSNFYLSTLLASGRSPGADIVWYRITASTGCCFQWTATVVCPGSRAGEQIIVVDPLECWLDGPESELVGAAGAAARTSNCDPCEDLYGLSDVGPYGEVQEVYAAIGPVTCCESGTVYGA